MNFGEGPNSVRLDSLDPSSGTPLNFRKLQRLQNTGGTFFIGVGSARLISQIGKRVAETGFLVVQSLAVNVLLGIKFIGDTIKTISPEKQLIRRVRLSPVAISGTGLNGTPVIHVSDQHERPIGCGVVKLTVIQAMTQALVTVKAPVTLLHMVETLTYLMRGRQVLVAGGVPEDVRVRAFTNFVATWSKVSITLPKKRTIAQGTTLSDSFWTQPYKRDGISITQLHKEAKPTEQKLERHSAGTQDDASRSKMH